MYILGILRRALMVQLSMCFAATGPCFEADQAVAHVKQMPLTAAGVERGWCQLSPWCGWVLLQGTGWAKMSRMEVALRTVGFIPQEVASSGQKIRLEANAGQPSCKQNGQKR